MKLYILAPALIAISMTSAGAQDRQAPPKMPIADIAQALGISEDATEKCFTPPKMDEKPDGEKAPKAPEGADAPEGPQGGKGPEGPRGGPKGPPSDSEKAEVLKCLQASNSALTVEKLDSVMQSFGPPHGAPE